MKALGMDNDVDKFFSKFFNLIGKCLQTCMARNKNTEI